MTDPYLQSFLLCIFAGTNSHRRGGELTVLNKFDADLSDCIQMCKETLVCVAIDWNQKSETCWLHRQHSACNQLLRGKDVMHISKVSCHGRSIQIIL